MTDRSRSQLLALALSALLPLSNSLSAQEESEETDPPAEEALETAEATASSADSDPGATELLRQMAAAHEGLETLRGAFVQRTQSEELLEDIETTGTFICREPDLFRYDYNPSEGTSRSIYFVNGDTAHAYVEELNQVEVYHLDDSAANGRGLRQILIGLDGAVDELLETYTATLLPLDTADAELGEDMQHLQLIPREGVDPQGFVAIDLWVDNRTLLPGQLKMVAESNESLTLRITDLELNPELSDSDFNPHANVPEGTDFVEQ